MGEATYIIISFFAGLFLARLWYSVVGLGHASIMMKRTISDCLLVMANNVQSAKEAYEIKYYALEVAERDDKYIDFQKKVDEQQLGLMQKTIIRNFIANIPKQYSHMIDFHDWQTAMNCLTKELKRRNGDD